MDVINLIEHRKYDIAMLTEEYLYNSFNEESSVNELYLTNDDFYQIGDGNASFSLSAKMDNFRKIYAIYMHTTIGNTIQSHIGKDIAIYINRDTFKSEFFIFKPAFINKPGAVFNLKKFFNKILGKNKNYHKIKRTYPEYWEETGFADLAKRLENVLIKIAYENKDRPIGVSSYDWKRMKKEGTP